MFSSNVIPLDDFVIFLAIGRLFTWMLQTAGLLRPLWEWHPLLTELSECDLCLGFWTYLILGALFGLSLGLSSFFLDVIVLAAVSSFTAHLLRLGWNAKFGVTIIE